MLKLKKRITKNYKHQLSIASEFYKIVLFLL